VAVVGDDQPQQLAGGQLQAAVAAAGVAGGVGQGLHSDPVGGDLHAGRQRRQRFGDAQLGVELPGA